MTRWSLYRTMEYCWPFVSPQSRVVVEQHVPVCRSRFARAVCVDVPPQLCVPSSLPRRTFVVASHHATPELPVSPAPFDDAVFLSLADSTFRHWYEIEFLYHLCCIYKTESTVPSPPLQHAFYGQVPASSLNY